jgi:integrase
VNLLPVLRDELGALKAKRDPVSPDAYVLPSAVGTRQDRHRVRGRVLAGAIKGANEQLAKDGHAPLPDGLTLHALRRTFASVLVALCHDPRYVMDQIGHANPTVTLGIYAQVMRASHEDRERLRQLVEGDHLAVAGSSAVTGRESGADGATDPVVETAD